MQKKPLLMRRLPLLLILGSLTLFIGCTEDKKSGSTDDPNTSAPAGSVARLFTYPEIQGCALCHGPGGEEVQGPNLSTPALFQQSLVNRNVNDYPSWYVASDCSTQPNMAFVKPGKPEESSLLAAVILGYASSIPEAQNNCNPAYGFHTGGANATLDGNQALQADLLLWISNGANP